MTKDLAHTLLNRANTGDELLSILDAIVSQVSEEPVDESEDSDIDF
jgi:hypothetical protein